MKFVSIQQSAEFNRIFKNGVKLLTPFFVLYYLTEQCASVEIGIIAAKKQFNKAVDRNFCKRRIRAAIRNLPELKTNLKIIVVCRKQCLSCDFQDIYQHLENHLSAVSS